jgi:CBS domain-containing protein
VEGSHARKVTILLSPAAGGGAHLKVLQELRKHGAVNAFAFRTIAAITARGELATTRLAEVPPELPVIIVWIDAADIIERVLPRVRPLVTEGVVTVDDTTLDWLAIARPPDLPKTLTVADVMTREVVSVAPDTPIREVVANLLTRDFRAVPVVDAGRKVVGIITNGDLVRRGGLPLRLELLKTFDTPALHDQLERMTQEHRTANEVMTREVAVVPQSTDVRHAADLMLQRRLKRLPVVDDEGRLTGIVSRVDLLRSVMRLPGSAPAARVGVPGSFSGDTALADIMSHSVPAVAEEATVSEVLNVVMATRLNRAVVVDADQRVLGVISDADLVERLDPDMRPGMLASLMHRVPFVHRGGAEDEDYQRATARTARDLMHTDVVIANQRDLVRDVLLTMLERKRKVIPVVDDEQRLVGIVDRADLLRAMTRT